MAKFPCVTGVSVILRGIQEAAGVGIEVTATDVIDRINNALADTSLIKGGGDINAAVVDRVVDELTREMKKNTARHAINLGAINNTVEHIKTNYATDFVRGLKALFVGDEKSIAGSRASIASAQASAEDDFFSGLYSDLNDEKLLNVLWSGDYDRDIYLAGKALARGDKEALAQLDPRAVKVAEVVQKQEAHRRELLNRYGAGIEEQPGRVATQMHSISDIRHAKKRIRGDSNSFGRKGRTAEDSKAWVDWTFARLDLEATFDAKIRKKGKTAMKRILYDIYETLSIGDIGLFELDEVFRRATPGQDPSRRLRESRVLHFTDEGAFEYMRMFGGKSLKDTLLHEIKTSGKALGIIQTLGPDSTKNLNSILRKLKEESTGRQKQQIAEFLTDISSHEYNPGYKPKLSWMYTHVTGHNDRVVKDLPALLFAGVRTSEFITKLGMSAVSSLTDIGGSASDHYFVRGQGHIFSSLMDAFMAPLSGQAVTKNQRADFAKAVGVGVDGIKHSIFDRFGGYDSPPGRMTQLMNMYFKWNGLGPWTDAVRRGHFLANSSYMGSIFKSGSIDARQRALLRQYNVFEADIQTLIDSPPIYTFDGSEYFDPRLIEDDKLRLKMRNFFLDRNDHGILTPGAETNYLTEAGRGRGDVLREINSLFWQFKQFPYAMLMRNTRRNAFGLGAEGVGDLLKNPRGELTLFTLHVAMLTGMGGLAMTIKDILKNREPVVPTTWAEGQKQILRAFMHGGSAGLMGDLLMGEAKGVGDFLVRQGGPAVGDLMDFGDFSQEAIKNVFAGDDMLDNKGGTKLWRSIRNDLPFTNIFYTKAVLDIGVLYWLGELIDPGFLEKHNRGLENTRGGAGLLYKPEFGD